MLFLEKVTPKTPPPETEERPRIPFFALQAEQMEPEPTVPVPSLQLRADGLQRRLPAIPPTPGCTYCPFHQEMEAISSPLESGLDS